MKEALKLALEALENALNKPMWDRPKMTKTITAIKEALAQPEHEPVHSVQSNGRHSPLLTHMMNKRTTQPKRPWVGLTDEEMDKWIEEEHDVLRWAEAKLKEKNT